MRTKMMCLALLLMALCGQITPSAAAYSEGDWTPTTKAEWWWKYVYPGEPHPHWLKDITVADVIVGADTINTATGDLTTGVVITFKNRSASYVKCGGSVAIVHKIVASNGSVLHSQAMTKALLPAQFGPGQAYQIRGTAFTPARLRGGTHLLEVQVR